MKQAQIVVRDLSKTYSVPEREPGLGAALRGLVHRSYRDVEAVHEIAFRVEAGERVGLIGVLAEYGEDDPVVWVLGVVVAGMFVGVFRHVVSSG